MYTLQKLLTHKSSMMTQRYAHLRDEALRKASDLAGSIIAQTINNTPDAADSESEPEKSSTANIASSQD